MAITVLQMCQTEITTTCENSIPIIVFLQKEVDAPPLHISKAAKPSQLLASAVFITCQLSFFTGK